MTGDGVNGDGCSNGNKRLMEIVMDLGGMDAGMTQIGVIGPEVFHRVAISCIMVIVVITYSSSSLWLLPLFTFAMTLSIAPHHVQIFLLPCVMYSARDLVYYYHK